MLYLHYELVETTIDCSTHLHTPPVRLFPDVIVIILEWPAAHGCPERGCYACPSYNRPGLNPHFQDKAKKAQHVRAKHFMDSGAADSFRKTAEL